MPRSSPNIRGRVLVTGTSWSGKSTLAKYFRGRGENAFDSEGTDELRGLNQSVDFEGRPFRITKAQWRRADEWQHFWDEPTLARFLAPRKDVILFGASDNMFDLADLFDFRIYLKLNWMVLQTRLSHPSRENDWGSEPGQMRWIRARAREWPRKARASGFSFVDASQSPARIYEVVTRLISLG